MTTQSAFGAQAYVVTGPTSGIGLRTALALSKRGAVVLVGRDSRRLRVVQEKIASAGRKAFCVVCDLSDPASVRRASADIIALNLSIAGLINNAGMMQMHPTRNALGWDMSFATNHLGPFALTEALVAHLPDGAHVVFLASAVENPEHKPAKAFGFRGGRYISARASARGEWAPGGSNVPGADAYATSKQTILAAALAFARETPRLRFSAVEPGVNPSTALGRDANAFVRLLSKYIMPLMVPLFVPFIKVLSTPKRAARVITNVVIDTSGQTGVYFDQSGEPMLGSELVRDPGFQDRVVAETREFLSLVAK
ncbi:SDR family NAD(P)-dependent oxidoreductase [Sodalis ligni]|jgi:NAD(P)-dependent dehydrogenase (short-subunit alcohol dehydrogenase family)|uniref:Short subunit dehydrogenase n=1 Tax=Sodalis ligni TaxID=2697027 RepID=A0A4R1NF19_9GAMM|nr:SDR family NAD(P)-dependent oxidoreductase [Sodalis ligni]TCL06225.1 short subunit dehydrogenase [Sodalis ligni]